jgi:ELWxxDGT repeat protein
MLITVFSGCTGTSDVEPEPEPELDWQVHYAVSGADLPACNSDTMGRLYYVESDDGFQVCKTNGWNFIDISGPAGSDGADGDQGLPGDQGDLGAQGDTGDQGPQGTQGAPGSDGTDGASLIFAVSESTTCSTGGRHIDIGHDANGDSVLSAEEISSSVDICDGADGDKGDQGDQGDQGDPGPPGAQGDQGDPGPVGAPGNDGTDGTDGIDGTDGLNALVSTSAESAGSNCANGGVKVEAGVDDNADGILSASEVDHTQYVCDGGSSVTTILTTQSAPSASECSSGGMIISSGLDNGDGGGITANGQLESGEADYITTYCSNFVVSVAADICDGSSNGGVEHVTVLDTRLFFGAGCSYLSELWAYETTNDTAWQVADIRPGASGSYPGNLAGFTVMGRLIFFDANDGSNGRELWVHDVSNGSTWMAADILPGSSGSDPGGYGGMIVIGTQLFFDAWDGSNGRELWGYDSYNHTAWQVADINSASGTGSNVAQASGFIVVGTKLYFSANDGSNGTEIWVHETANDSTWMVTDLSHSSGGSPTWSSCTGSCHNNVVAGSRIYISIYGNVTGKELWVIETTNDTAWALADINPGTAHGDPGENGGMIVIGTRLFFDAWDGSNGRELWAYETTNDTAWQVADINSGSSDSEAGSYSGFIVVGTKLYFSANDGSNGNEIWVHETANDSTWMVSGFSYSSSGSPSWSACTLLGSYHCRTNVVVDSRIYISIYGNLTGIELWVIETTDSSMREVANIYGSSMSYSMHSYPGEDAGITLVGNRIYFDAYRYDYGEISYGEELWMMEIEHTVTYG